MFGIKLNKIISVVFSHLEVVDRGSETQLQMGENLIQQYKGYHILLYQTKNLCSVEHVGHKVLLVASRVRCHHVTHFETSHMTEKCSIAMVAENDSCTIIFTIVCCIRTHQIAEFQYQSTNLVKFSIWELATSYRWVKLVTYKYTTDVKLEKVLKLDEIVCLQVGPIAFQSLSFNMLNVINTSFISFL